ncbi:unnamed protein product [Peniophora sp. CBMAI 1063]|nr:unnamed protein product [Peniophora sp. CBMAI 1063]
MMVPTSLAVALSLTAVATAYKPTEASFNWVDIKQFFAFGDSYTFVQGTAGYANFSFIGDLIYNPNWTAHDLLSNKIIPHNTSSDGSNWVEYLTGCFSGSPLHCSRQLWDFAFAGSDITEDLLPLHHNFTSPLDVQVAQFVKNGALEAIPKVEDHERITAWWIGINDTGDVLGHNITDLTAFWAEEMTSYFNAVERAYSFGLRGAYLFINVPPEDRSPNDLGTTRQAAAAESIAGYNSALASSVANFSASHPDLHVSSFDAHAWFGKALDDYEELGFKNVTGFCTCEDDSYFWYNTGHPTQRVHKLLAAAIEEQLVKESKSSHR